jgi:Cys-rich repeat protein
MTARLQILALVLAGGLAACTTKGIGYQGQVFTCARDADCGAGQVCQAGVCAPPGGALASSSSSGGSSASTPRATSASSGGSSTGASVSSGSAAGSSGSSTRGASAASGSSGSSGSSGGGDGGFQLQQAVLSGGASLSEPLTSSQYTDFGVLSGAGAGPVMTGTSHTVQGGILTH